MNNSLCDSGCLFYSNTGSPNVSFVNCNIINNTAEKDAAVAMIDNSYCLTEDDSDNCKNGIISLDSSIFINNTAIQYKVGLIYLQHHFVDLIVSNCNFTNN